MTEVTEPMPSVPFVDENRMIHPEWARWLERGRVSTQTSVGGILSGFNQQQQQLADQLAAEAAARIAADNAISSGGDGTGTSDAAIYSGVATSGAAWVVASTLVLTTTGAGGYTLTHSPDTAQGGITPEPTTPSTFNGNWRIVEELTSGGTEYVLASGTFTVEYAPASTTPTGESGIGDIYFPALTVVSFVGFPAAPVASNEVGQVDIRLEFQRASGSNNATQLNGSNTVAWA